ncbi:hypothetical protein K1T71_003578 [Dendrolimus kikuchii]|uniref:Uncharacterized protein n=1 Tax=Dendrolimus kikuchii TaxID=765133 RepID=A0ACC1DC24_9NEOP|nr:hypothetical protein K1T71_003578 [Dendrolimus kikuchii]
MDANQKAFAELCTMFTERMEAFEGELKNATPCNSLATLAADFLTFKSFFLKSLQSLQDQMLKLSQSVDNLEMRSRRKILLLHGVPEEQQEDTADVIKNIVLTKFKLPDFKVDHISRCHRMGKYTATQSRPRPILFKLIDVSIRSKIWMAKTKLKGSGVTVSEFLTKYRHDLFMRMRHNVFLAARHKFGINKCWTREGSVYVVSVDGSRHRINSLSDLRKIPQEDILQEELTKTSTAKIMAAAPKSKRLGATKK